MTNPGIPPIVPVRGSSISPTRASKIQALTNQTMTLRRDRAHKYKEIKHRHSYDSKYWDQVTEHADVDLQLTSVDRQLNQELFNVTNSGEDFDSSPQGIELNEKIIKARIKRDWVVKRASSLTLSTTNMDLVKERSWLRHFLSSTAGGAGIQSLNEGPRDKKVQSNLRNDLLARSPYKIVDGTKGYWCPITQQYCDPSHMNAAHIVPRNVGQATFLAIFGLDELESSRNATLMLKSAEYHFDKGHFVLVPTVKDPTNTEEILAWEKMTPKKFTIKVLNQDAMKKDAPYWLGAPIPAHISHLPRPITYNDLNNTVINFGENPPRTRYLYYHYCIELIKLTLNSSGRHTGLWDEWKKVAWATPGKYLRFAYLKAIIQEIGHDELMIGAYNDGTDKDHPENPMLALAAAIDAKDSDGDSDED